MLIILLFAGLGFWTLTLTIAWLVWFITPFLLPKRQEMQQEPERLEDPPAAIQDLISMESEEWARQDLETQAQDLYNTLHDWDKVHATLIQIVGEPPVQEVTDRAWAGEPQAVDTQDSPIAEGF
ncbi:hypothetical protein LCGC14_0740240 [marine sediment metagenome]|uniref:Uncharacterized protein n=1 Tax=marine sediment metagenome TaxID=412755 RepID=A0A0F9Q6X9_9ZZZZ